MIEVTEKTDVRFRDIESLKIETVWLNVYLGGTWSAQSRHHLYIDNVAIAREAALGIRRRARRGE